MLRKVFLMCLFLVLSAASCTSPAASPAPKASPPAAQPPAPLPTATQAVPPTPVGQPSPTARVIREADAFAFEQNQRLARGVNLGNALEAPKEGEWGVELKEEFFQIIKEGGFDSIRVPIRWNAHAAEKAPYIIDPAFFERIDWVVANARKQNLSVILDFHHYLEIMEEPRVHKERFLSIWEQIALRYQKEPDSVYFELLNEPNGTISNTRAWNDMLKEAIQIIRATNPNRTIIVGPGNWNSVSDLPMLELPENDRNLIVTFHYYQPFQFTHQGADWADGSEAWLGTTWTGTKTEKFSVDRDLEAARKWGEANHRPIFMGEFGAFSEADMESRATWTAYMARAAEQRGFSWAYWEFCSGFGVYDQAANTWVEPIYQALLP